MMRLEFRTLKLEEFKPLWTACAPVAFAEQLPHIEWNRFLTDQEKINRGALGDKIKNAYHLYLAAFDGNQLAGWTFGEQIDRETYRMQNSAVMPNYRRQGLYTMLLEKTLEEVQKGGFQKIESRHHMTNNSVIIPKLKAGFVISGFELCDSFGTLVHLCFYTNKLRKKTLDYRSGFITADEEIQRVLSPLS